MIIDFITWLVDTLNYRIEKKKRKKEQERMERERHNSYLTMSTDMLMSLHDAELFDAVRDRLRPQFNSGHGVIDGLNKLNGTQRIFVVADIFEREIEKRGMHGFLLSENSCILHISAEALMRIGAVEHSELLSDFIERNCLDTNVDDNCQLKRSCDEYDTDYRMLETIEDALILFVRSNIQYL